MHQCLKILVAYVAKYHWGIKTLVKMFFCNLVRKNKAVQSVMQWKENANLRGNAQSETLSCEFIA